MDRIPSEEPFRRWRSEGRRTYSMRRRMLVFYTATTLVVLLVVSVVQSRLELSVLQVNESYYTSLLVQTAETLDSHLANYQKLSAVFAEGPMLRFYLKQIASNRSLYEVGSQWVQKEILKYPNKSMFTNIYIYMPGMSPINAFYEVALQEVDPQMERLMALYGAHRASRSACVVTGVDPYQLTLVYPVYDRDELLAMLRLDLEMEFFQKIIGEVEQDEENLLVILEGDSILFSNRPELVGTEIEDTGLLEGAVVRPISSVGWDFAGTLPSRKIQQVMSAFGGTFVLMILLIMAILTCYCLLNFRLLMTPMRDIADRMRLVGGGDLDAELPGSRVAEFQIIVDTFNAMVKKVGKLLETVYYQQVYLRKAQIGEMQSKFNPHFLYNTLDMIYWHLVDKEDEDTAEMVVALSEILRYSISSDSEFNAVAEERRQIENYLLLQSSRLGESFEWEIHFEEDILQYRIPCLLLQPLVENAVNHAFQGDRGYKYIGVTGHRQEGALVLTVVDNGVGMSREAIERIFGEEAQQPDGKGVKLGINLVHKRLQYIYGGQYGIQIQSEPGQGCSIRVLLEACENPEKYMAPPSGTREEPEKGGERCSM